MPDVIDPGSARAVAKLLRLEAQQAIVAGDSVKAHEALHTILTLGDHVREVPAVITSLVGLSMEAMVLDFVEGAYRYRPLENAELIERLSALDPRADMKRSMLGEGGAMHDMVREAAGKLDRFPLSGWHRYHRAKLLRITRLATGALDAPYSMAQPVYQKIDDEFDGLPALSPVAGILTAALSAGHATASQFETRVALFRFAVTARRFRAAHGRWPDAGEVELPVDEFSGERVAYEKIEAGVAVWVPQADRTNQDFAIWRWDTDAFPNSVPERQANLLDGRPTPPLND